MELVRNYVTLGEIYRIKTIEELKMFMKEECYHEDYFRFHGSCGYPGYYVENDEGLWVYGYSDRGYDKVIDVFESEEEYVLRYYRDDFYYDSSDFKS